MLSHSQIIAPAFKLDADLIPDGAGSCAICGRHAPGVAIKRVAKSTTADIADTFRHGHLVCETCAACFAEPRFLTSNLYADADGNGIKPMVAQSSATLERPSWRDLVRGLHTGTQTVCVFTSNTKRRLWLNAPVSIVGFAWRVLMVHENIERVLMVDYAALLETLDFIESVMESGYSKAAIANTLLSSHKITSQNPQQAITLEHRLKAIRSTDEFALALFIAQKEES